MSIQLDSKLYPNKFQVKVGWDVHYSERSWDTLPRSLHDPTLKWDSLEEKNPITFHKVANGPVEDKC